MIWNVIQLQERFALRDQALASELPELRRKALQNDNYKRIHDRQIGAHQLFIHLATTNALSSSEAFLAKLRDMRKNGPFEFTGAFDARNVTPGWDKELDTLLSEFS